MRNPRDGQRRRLRDVLGELGVGVMFAAGVLGLACSVGAETPGKSFEDPILGQPKQGFEDPILKPGQKFDDPILRPKKGFDDPILKPGQKFEDPILQPKKGFEDPILKPGQKFDDPILRPKKGFDDPILKPGQKFDDPILQPKKGFEDPILKPGQKFEDPILHPASNAPGGSIRLKANRREDLLRQLKSRFGERIVVEVTNLPPIPASRPGMPPGTPNPAGGGSNQMNCDKLCCEYMPDLDLYNCHCCQ